jgi:hypothetical protein
MAVDSASLLSFLLALVEPSNRTRRRQPRRHIHNVLADGNQLLRRRRRPNNRTGLPPHAVWMLGAPDAPCFAAHPRPVARPSADPNLIDCPAEGRGPSSVEAQSAVVRGAE